MDFGPEVTEYADKTVGVYGGKFYPFHHGHLSFIMKAQSMVDILFVAVQHDEEHEKALLTADTKFDWVDHRVREAWIAETLKEFPNIRVLSQYEPRTDNHMNDPRIHNTYSELISMVGGKIDIIFSNTHEYDNYFSKYLPQSKHVVFYEKRDLVNISATQIRNDGVYSHWDMLPQAVQNHYKKRVALCGIESTGKTHLSKMLATLFNSVAVPEYGRLYYDRINAYTSVDNPSDYVDIAAGHVHLLNEAERETNHILFVDTDLIYTQFFYEQSYGTKHPVLDAMIKTQADKIDCWLWYEPYNPHELDGTRLNITDETRQKNRDHLLKLYQDYGIKINIIDEPDRDMRFQKSVQIVNQLF